MDKKITTEYFIKKARKIYGDKYDYSKVRYVDSRTKVRIVCPKHGEFLIRPDKVGRSVCLCPKCGYEHASESHKGQQVKTTEQFIDDAKKVHGGKYDYSKVKYVRAHEKVCIICPKHGEFWQEPCSHTSGQGCPVCGKEKLIGNNHNTNLTTEEFIEKARKKHGDRYDYSKVKYVDKNSKICVICPIHGEFYVTPAVHLHSTNGGCKECRDEKLRAAYTYDTEKFIKKAKEIHGDKYDYSKVKYKDSYTKVCIICPKHGEFWQTPNLHAGCKSKCPECAKEELAIKLTKTTEQFIEEACKIHGDKYDYSRVKYVNSATKVCIVCPKHGEFWTNPVHFLHGHGCPECAIENSKSTTEEFIKKSNEIHGGKYDYSKVKYINNRTPVCIICPEHGEFWQAPHVHLDGHGCYECGRISFSNSQRLSTEEFINRAKKVHGEKYDYSKVEYKDSNTKVCIICSKHGEFWQTPNIHLSGAGCPICKESKLEIETRNFLMENNIKFISQKRFPWLRNKYPMSIDFYLPEYNAAIECQGQQHFDKIRWFGQEDSEKRFTECVMRDKMKNKLCEKHGVKIFYYSKLGIDYPYKVYEDLGEMLKTIKDYAYFETIKKVLCEAK